MPSRRSSSRSSLSVFGAVLFYAAMTVIGALGAGKRKSSRQLYTRKLEQAPWAPPSWAFGIAWSVINVFVTRALYILLQEENKGKRDRALLALQGGIWLVFCTFGWAYFRKKSPLLAAIWTIMDAGLATASVIKARKRGTSFAANYLPLLAWTYYASTLAVYQALKNNDPLLKTPPLIEARP